MEDEKEGRSAKLEGALVVLLREVKELKIRSGVKTSKAERRLDAAESRLLAEVDARIGAEQSQRMQAEDSLLLRLSAVEEARARLESQMALDQKQTEMLFKTEVLEAYTDMESHVEAEIHDFKAHVKSEHFLKELASLLRDSGQVHQGAIQQSAQQVKRLEDRVAELESRLHKSELANTMLTEELSVSKVAMAARMDERVLAMSRDMHSEVSVVQSSMQNLFDSFVHGRKVLEMEQSEKIRHIEKAMDKIDTTGMQMMRIAEEYMAAAQGGHQEQMEHCHELEQSMQNRQEEVANVLEQLARSVSSAELQIVSVSKDLERYRGLDSLQSAAKLEGEYARKMEEIGSTIEAMEAEKNAIVRSVRAEYTSVNDMIARAVQAQTRQLHHRLMDLEHAMGLKVKGTEDQHPPRSRRGSRDHHERGKGEQEHGRGEQEHGRGGHSRKSSMGSNTGGREALDRVKEASINLTSDTRPQRRHSGVRP